MTREEMAVLVEEFVPGRASAEIAAELRKTAWQPINSAPKDDAPVVLYMGDWLTPAFIAARWNGKDWLVGQHATVQSPTHWVPLPAPPASEGTPEGTP